MSKLDPLAVVCSSDGCTKLSAIVHCQKPYCGHHALELLETGEDWDFSATSAKAPAGSPQKERDQKDELEANTAGSLTLTKVGDE